MAISINRGNIYIVAGDERLVLLFRKLVIVIILGSISSNANSAGNWYAKEEGDKRWVRIGGSCKPQSQLRGGHFDDDGNIDIFSAWGGNWYISFSTRVDGENVRMAKWKKVAVSEVPLSKLRFGDFNGDGLTDIFSSWGGKWHSSNTFRRPPPDNNEFGGLSRWFLLTSSDIPVSKLRFGDFNGDGKTDVFTKWGGKWRFSSAGNESWKVMDINHQTTPGVKDLGVNDLLFGNYIGPKHSTKEQFRSDRVGCTNP